MGGGWDTGALTKVFFQILMDTKHLQKDINGLTGKLDRTFAVTDEMVFKVNLGFCSRTFRAEPLIHVCLSSPAFQDAKKDESVRKSYKYLAALHEVGSRP